MLNLAQSYYLIMKLHLSRKSGQIYICNYFKSKKEPETPSNFEEADILAKTDFKKEKILIKKNKKEEPSRYKS